MKKSLLMTTAAIALIAGTSLSVAQDRKEGAGAAPAPAAQQNAPAEKMSPPSAGQRGTESKGAPNARPDSKAEMKNDTKSSAQAPSSASDKKVEGKTDSKSEMKASESRDNKATNTRASETTTKSSDTKSSDAKTGDAKTGDAKSSATQNNAQTDSTKSSASQSTTGQGAAGARSVNLTTEQKTTIKTVIKEQKVTPVTNVNFSISVGSRIPREVRHYPLPSRIVEIHPAWRGFQYILVREEILVIDPNTLEIVAVIDV